MPTNDGVQLFRGSGAEGWTPASKFLAASVGPLQANSSQHLSSAVAVILAAAGSAMHSTRQPQRSSRCGLGRTRLLVLVCLILCVSEAEAATCGDGLREEGEQCEDGNQVGMNADGTILSVCCEGSGRSPCMITLQQAQTLSDHSVLT